MEVGEVVFRGERVVLGVVKSVFLRNLLRIIFENFEIELRNIFENHF